MYALEYFDMMTDVILSLKLHASFLGGENITLETILAVKNKTISIFTQHMSNVYLQLNIYTYTKSKKGWCTGDMDSKV